MGAANRNGSVVRSSTTERSERLYFEMYFNLRIIQHSRRDISEIFCLSFLEEEDEEEEEEKDFIIID